MQHQAVVRVPGLWRRRDGVHVGLLTQRCSSDAVRSLARCRSPRSGGSSCWRTVCAPAARCCTTAWGTRTGRRSTCCRYAIGQHGKWSGMRASGTTAPAAGEKQRGRGTNGRAEVAAASQHVSGHNVRGIHWSCTAPIAPFDTANRQRPPPRTSMFPCADTPTHPLTC